MEAYPEVARRDRRGGHLVGNHSYYHARMPLLSDEGLADGRPRRDRAIREHAASIPDRGSVSRSARAPTTRSSAAGSNRPATGTWAGTWTRATGTSPRPRIGIASALTLGLAEAPGDAIVLLHAWPTRTPGAVDRLLPRMRDAGATFVTIDELGDEVRATVPA